MSKPPRVLVASDAPSDADVVVRLLADDFDNIAASTDPTRVVADFEADPPNVLVHAFRSVEASERYSLGLYRHGAIVHACPHASILLCGRDELRRAYELCRSRHFDDYVPFWPVQHDPHRLAFAIHQALRLESATGVGGASVADFVRQAQRIAELERLLAQALEHGGARVEDAKEVLDGAGRRIAAALDDFARAPPRVSTPAQSGAPSPAWMQEALARLKDDEIAPELQTIAGAVAPVGAWVERFRSNVEPHLASIRALKSMAQKMRPPVLVVDDDVFQTRLLETALGSAGIEVIGAATEGEALRLMVQRRPALVLMDIELPETDGIELTRRIKRAPQYADTRIVMISGHRERETVVESLRAGACDFLVKPFDRPTLLARVVRWLDDAAAAA